MWGPRLALAMLLQAGAIVAAAQDAPPIHFSVRPPGTAALKSGDHVELILTARIDPGWHLYSINQGPGGPLPTQIVLAKTRDARPDGAIIEPPPRVEFDSNFNIETAIFEDEVDFRVPIVITPDASGGKRRIAVDVRYQVCDARLCLPATVATAATEITIAGGPANDSHTSSPSSATSEREAASQTEEPTSQPVSSTVTETPAPVVITPIQSTGLLAFLWLSMSMGALSLLTPCVFPMVPITVSYFSNHAGATRGSAIKHAAIYAAGIILTFIAVGLTLAAAFGAGGVNRLAANPWVNLFITAIFLMFAASLFGAYIIQVPARFLNRLDTITRSHESGRVAGTLLLGCMFTLTSFTCTAPFVGTLLVMAAQGSWRWPISGMLGYSAVFALPFFILALTPQLVSQLPRAGGWMNSVKVVMGFLEIAAAMKFLSNADLVWGWGVFTRERVLAIWIACGVAIVLYVFGLIRFRHDVKIEHVGAARLVVALAFLAITVALVPGLLGRRLGELDSFLPPSASELQAKVTKDEIPWILNDYEAALRQAASERKPLFIDFTGYTCTNCRWMEANMFPRSEIRRELERFTTARLYTDGSGPVFTRQQAMQQKMFHTVALPLYAILNSDGSAIASFAGLTRDSSEFLAFLRRRNQAESAKQ